MRVYRITLHHILLQSLRRQRGHSRLGEAYENVTDIAPGQPGIAKQLLLVADVLDECVTMNLSSSDMDKDCSKELFKRCFMNGIRIKNVQH